MDLKRIDESHSLNVANLSRYGWVTVFEKSKTTPKKESKGKDSDSLHNIVLLDQATYDKLNKKKLPSSFRKSVSGVIGWLSDCLILEFLENNDLLRDAVKERPDVTTRELETMLGCSHQIISNHLHDLRYRRVLARWVPHALSLPDAGSCDGLSVSSSHSTKERVSGGLRYRG
uniref:Uncharacterized protein n=1 Tax=Caenorhabditis japonica TaxID=281687 RepID=A0A8R1ERY7_CAEJA